MSHNPSPMPTISDIPAVLRAIYTHTNSPVLAMHVTGGGAEFLKWYVSVLYFSYLIFEGEGYLPFLGPATA